jgi:glycosyltransferase involved in cell wall biosynthesis
MFPEAPIYTSYCTPEWRKRLDNKVITGWLQYGPFPKLRKFIPLLRIWWFTSLKFDDYDLVISSSGAEAKGIKVPKNTTHINYCHAPTHYYWSRYNEYMVSPGFGSFDWLARIGLKLLVSPLRNWDYKAAQRPNFMIANSTYTQTAIKKYYGRGSVVIHPPVYFERFQKPENITKNRQGFIVSGRQTPYKRFDLAIKACTKLNLPLVVVGDGPDHKKLQSLAGPSIKFIGRVTDEEVERQFSHAQALIFPGIDDFGITAVEAMAAGTPVIAYKAGGALDYVIEKETGAFFNLQTTESLVKKLKAFKTETYDSDKITTFAKTFSPAYFSHKMKEFILNV